METGTSVQPASVALPRAGWRWGAILASPWTVAGVVAAVYTWWLVVFFLSGHDARDFILIGRQYITQSHASSIIRVDPHYHYARPGQSYDGQFFYFIAVDPLHARGYLDGPSYRYTKILYPMTARLLALGRADLIPYTLILVNWLSVILGTLAVAAWLRRKRLSPWLALIYGLYAGLFIAFQRDLTEPMAYALIAFAVYLLDFGGRFRLAWSGIVFALAILTRDKSAIFAIVLGVGLLLDSASAGSLRTLTHTVLRNLPGAALFLALAGVPMLLYKIFLHFWLGSFGLPLTEQAAPLSGIASTALHPGDLIVETLAVFLPAGICALVACRALWKRQWDIRVVLLLVIIQLSVVTLNPGYFDDVFGMLRVSIGIVLAALYCLPTFDRVTGGNRTWLWASSAAWLWLSAIWLVLGSYWLLA